MSTKSILICLESSVGTIKLIQFNVKQNPVFGFVYSMFSRINGKLGTSLQHPICKVHRHRSHRFIKPGPDETIIHNSVIKRFVLRCCLPKKYQTRIR